ncbi:hypothetical protein MMC19_007743 [Ptychographa xylographoides]|nr:hypothetical protein [Ptychographa xylographoides]
MAFPVTPKERAEESFKFNLRQYFRDGGDDAFLHHHARQRASAAYTSHLLQTGLESIAERKQEERRKDREWREELERMNQKTLEGMDPEMRERVKREMRDRRW